MNLNLQNAIKYSAFEKNIKNQVNKISSIGEERKTNMIYFFLNNWKRILKSVDDENKLPKDFLPLEGSLKIEDFFNEYETDREQFYCELYYFDEDDNECEMDFRFFCDNIETANMVVEKYMEEEGILYVNPNRILDNLDIYQKTYKMEYNTSYPEPDADAEIFDVDECPCCMECFDTENKMSIVYSGKIKRNTFCGHPLCIDCFDTICESDNKCCPMCRKDYEETGDIDISTHRLNIDDDYISGLQSNCETDELCELVCMKDLIDGLLHFGGWASVLDAKWYDSNFLENDEEYLFIVY